MRTGGFISLKDDPSIIIKGADRGSVVVFWGREDCLMKAHRQLEDKDLYEQVPNNILMKALGKIRLQGGFLITSWVTMLNLQDFICFHRFTNGYMMCRKTGYFILWLLYYHPVRKSNPTVRIPAIF